MENKKPPADPNNGLLSVQDIAKAKEKKTATELERRNAHLTPKLPATELVKGRNS